MVVGAGDLLFDFHAGGVGLLVVGLDVGSCIWRSGWTTTGFAREGATEALGAFFGWWWGNVFRVVDAIVEDCPGAALRVHEEFFAWKGWVQYVPSGFKDSCLWGREDIVGVFKDRVTSGHSRSISRRGRPIGR